jgi:hypothetical protein
MTVAPVPGLDAHQRKGETGGRDMYRHPVPATTSVGPSPTIS